MKAKDYTTGSEIIEGIKEMGRLVDEMDIPFYEKSILIDSLKQCLMTFDSWHVRGRVEAEAEIKKEQTTFLGLLKWLFPW